MMKSEEERARENREIIPNYLKKLLFFIKFVSSAIILFSFFTGVASAETAKEATMALKKLEARTQAGISYRDYAPALGEAKFVVSLYLEGNLKETDLSRKITDAMELYEFANVLWGEKFKSTANYGYIFVNAGDIFAHSSSIASKYMQMFPEDNKSVADGGALLSQCDPPYKGCQLFIGTAISHIWTKASEQLKEITSILANSEGKKQKKT